MPVDPKRAQEIFLKASAIPEAGSRTFALEQECGNDRELRERVEALLRAHNEPDNLIDQPLVKPAETSVFGSQFKKSEIDSAFAETSGTVLAQRYKLLQQIGEGGMGTVWMAEQEKPVRRQVAVKIIKAGMDSAHVVARFEAERQALALMDHNNIARVLDAGTTDNGRPFFVMELVNGPPITQYCDDNQLSPQERLKLMVPVCRAIQHAHQKGIIHRDLKPTNILVARSDGNAVPKVIDFGVAKATGQRLSERTLFTEFGALIGTLEYMSPEQAELNNHDIDTRSDIYSLGVILYELLTGTTPLERERLKKAAFTEMLRKIREEEPPKPSTRLSNSKHSIATISVKRHMEPAHLARAVRGDLDWIVMKCLEKSRGRRYETANGLARDLERYLQDELVEAGAPSARYRLSKFMRRHRKALGTAAAFAALLILATIASAWQAVRATRAEALALAERDEVEQARRAEADQRLEADAARKLADEKAATAQAISSFLQNDLLGQADLGNQEGGPQGRDPNIKARTLLDRASKVLDGQFQDRPLTEAELRVTLGRTYMALLDYDQAQKHLRRALDLRTVNLGPDHPESLWSHQFLGELYLRQEKFERAETELRDVVQKRLATLGAEHPDTLAAKSALSNVYYYEGYNDKAVPLLREVLEARSKQLPADSPEILDLKNNLARIHLAARNYDQAEALFKEVAEKKAARLGTDHPSTYLSQHDLALTYHQAGKLDLAEPLLLEVYKGIRALYADDKHPRTLHARAFIANLYRDQGKFDQAEPIYKDVIAIQTALLGPDANDTLFTKRNLAQLYQAQEKFADAEAILLDVLQKRSAALGANHPEPGWHMQRLGRLYEAQGKFDQAEALYQKAYQSHASILGPTNPRTLSSRRYLAGLDLTQGQFDRAEPICREIFEERLRQLGPDNLDTLISKNDLASALEGHGKWQDALPARRELVDAHRRRSSVDQPALAAALTDLGRNLIEQAQAVEAELVLREAVTIRTLKQPDRWTTFETKLLLGASLIPQQKFDEAGTQALAGYQGMKRLESKVRPASRLHEDVERLSRLYAGQGKQTEADEWRKRLQAP